MWIVRSLRTFILRAFGLSKPRRAAGLAQSEQVSPAQPRGQAGLVVRLECEDDRPIMSSIGAQAPLMAGLARRSEPQDFMLAARLASVARLNPRAGRKTGPTELDRAVQSTGNRPAKVVVEVKTQRPGCLSPISARGTRAAWQPSSPMRRAA